MQATFSLVFSLIGLLTVASLLLPLARRLNFPYTVLPALVGGLLGVIVVASGEIQGLGILGDFLNAVHALDITSEVIFFVFLPALIFESALNITTRHLLEDIGPILVLAVLGVLISTITVGTLGYLRCPARGSPAHRRYRLGHRSGGGGGHLQASRRPQTADHPGRGGEPVQ